MLPKRSVILPMWIPVKHPNLLLRQIRLISEWVNRIDL
jgi:hypothetical protein